MNQEEQNKYKKLQEELLGCKTELGLALMNHNKTIDDFQVKLDEFNNFLTKYNELLDSHNSILQNIEEIKEQCDGYGVINQEWLKGFCQSILNKAKNIKQ